MRTIEDLQTEKRWITWKPEWDEKRQDYNKTPYSTYYNTRGKLRRAASDDPTTWDSYANVCGAVEGHDDMGIGLELTEGIAVIDIDCHDSDLDTNPLQTEILKLFSDTYCEISPSGKGIHILFCVDFDKLPVVERTDGKGLRINERFYMKNSKSDLECYVGGATNRYMTFTGNMVSDKPVLADCTGKLMYFLYKYMNRNSGTIEKLLDKARNDKRRGEIFRRLYDEGDMSDYNDDHSSADEALMNDLVYWLNGNYDDVLTAFYNSRLDRSFCLGHDSDNAEKGNKTQREQYMRDTYNKAMDGRTDFYVPKPGRPRKDNDGDGEGGRSRERLTCEMLEAILTERDISIRYNIITDKIEIEGYSDGLETLAISLEDDLGGQYTCATKKRIIDLVTLIAMKFQYNPVLDLLNSSKWDGEDHLSDVYKVLGIENDDLSKTLVLKWLWQGLILLRNTLDNAVTAEGILVLTGGQGKGKTSFFRRMALSSSFFLEGGKINSSDKDDQRRVITTWIAELGEIDATFKRTDVGALKSFLLRRIDEYRVAYGACDKVRPRRTNVCGTVNDGIFLVDQTGNRRYWTVSAEKIDKDLLWKFDPLQVWLQVWEQYAKADYEKGLSVGDTYLHGFRLTDDEFEQLNMRNSEYEYVPDWKIKIDEILNGDCSEERMKFMTVSEFVSTHKITGTGLTNVGKYLTSVGCESKTRKGYKLYKLPLSSTSIEVAHMVVQKQKV